MIRLLPPLLALAAFLAGLPIVPLARRLRRVMDVGVEGATVAPGALALACLLVEAGAFLGLTAMAERGL